MTDAVTYSSDGTVAVITLDDGKVNALSLELQGATNQALDRVEQDGSQAVVLVGNGRVFCGGFDLSVFASGDRVAALEMLSGGFTLATRLLSFPRPVIIAATGPAIAMGSFLLLSGDYRLGTPHARCQANEVAIGMALPTAALEIMRMRLVPAAFNRAVTLATSFSGKEAIAAGWLDELVEPDEIVTRAHRVATVAATTLGPLAHHTSKMRAREEAIAAIRHGIERLSSEMRGRESNR